MTDDDIVEDVKLGFADADGVATAEVIRDRVPFAAGD
jgi:hypothetical protein